MLKPATRDDVARLAGVSTAVVSYVVNGGPRPVSESTRRKVVQAIQDSGYQPNRAAQTLAQGRSRSIGLLIPNTTNPFLAELTRALGDHAYQAQYTLLLGDSADDKERERALVRQFLSQQLAGFVWYAVDQPPPIELLGNAAPLTVILNATQDQEDHKNLFLITTDEAQQGYLSAELLVECGCTKVGILAGPKHRYNSQQRLQGSLAALSDNKVHVEAIAYGDFTEEAGQKALTELRHCDGVVTANERQAIGLLHAAATCGIKIPDDLKLVAMNGSKASSFMVPSISTVDQDIRQLTAAVIEILNAETTELPHSSFIVNRRQSTEGR